MHICDFCSTFALEMKRIILFIIAFAFAGSVWAQVKLPQVRMLENQGWSVQHSVMSWDSLSVYFSAKAPQAKSYDLYIVRANGWRWGEPEKITSISTDEDELWPSISSDESMLFYVHRTPATEEKGSFEKTRIWRAWYRDNAWTEAAPIIISGEEDSQPQLLEDNCTLLFTRRVESKKHDGVWQNWTSTMLDDHNWTNPSQYTATPQPRPVLAVSGTLVMVKGGRPIAQGYVLVYDAMNEQLLQKAVVHTQTGRWQVPLQRQRRYRLALTAPGYSYHYIDIDTETLNNRTTRDFGSIALDDQLALTLQTYDSETQAILKSQKEILALGKLHQLTLRHEGYEDTTLTVNTQRPTVFTQTELDIAMRPKKSLHHFRVINPLTGDGIPEAQLRLNGQPTPKDTTLRINMERTLQISAKGYMFYDTLFYTGKDTRERTVLVALLPIQKDMVLQLRNIQFEHDSYELTESSNDELESLAQLLFMNPTLRIELSSHTDDQGSDKYNDRLSTLRGQAVEKWLLNRGIPAERMVIMGYGKRKPLVPNDSDEQRAINRRVEIKVLDF